MDVNKEMKTRRGRYIAAGAILGVGIGMLMNNIAPWSVIGVGLGFLADALMKNK